MIQNQPCIGENIAISVRSQGTVGEAGEGVLLSESRSRGGRSAPDQPLRSGIPLAWI